MVYSERSSVLHRSTKTAREFSKYLKLLLQKRQKLLPHKLIAKRLGEGSDITCKRQAQKGADFSPKATSGGKHATRTNGGASKLDSNGSLVEAGNAQTEHTGGRELRRRYHHHNGPQP